MPGKHPQRPPEATRSSIGAISSPECANAPRSRLSRNPLHPRSPAADTVRVCNRTRSSWLGGSPPVVRFPPLEGVPSHGLSSPSVVPPAAAVGRAGTNIFALAGKYAGSFGCHCAKHQVSQRPRSEIFAVFVLCTEGFSVSVHLNESTGCIFL